MDNDLSFQILYVNSKSPDKKKHRSVCDLSRKGMAICGNVQFGDIRFVTKTPKKIR